MKEKKRFIYNCIGLPVEILIRSILLIVIFISCFPLKLEAAEVEPPGSLKTLGPLIQATSFQDEYTGNVRYGGACTKVIERMDTAAAFENIQSCIVKINVDGYYGSGIIWDMEEDYIIIASNKHLLEKWSEEGYLTLEGQLRIPAEIVKISDEYDLGFIKAEISTVGYEEAVLLNEVRKDAAAYHNLQAGDVVFNAGILEKTETLENMVSIWYEGTVASPWWYIEEFDSYMLYAFCYAKPGMSGGGMFDGYGNFVGMVSGGTGGDESIAIPVSVMIDEYEAIRR